MIPALLNPFAEKATAARDALRATGGFDIREVAPALLADAAARAVADGARRLVIAGGDGSVGTVAGAVVGSGVEIAVVPSGRLNHLARDLRLPSDLAAASRVARDGAAVSLDAGFVNGRLFLNTSSVGAYVTFVRARDRLERTLGYGLASFIAAARLLVHLPAFPVTVEVDGVTRRYLTPLVFVAVGERDLKVPILGARVPGGRSALHVMVVRRRSGARAITMALAAAARGIAPVTEASAIDAFLVDRCRIEPRTHAASVDGEILAVDPPLDYRHVPGHLRVVVAPDDVAG